MNAPYLFFTNKLLLLFSLSELSDCLFNSAFNLLIVFIKIIKVIIEKKYPENFISISFTSFEELILIPIFFQVK